MISSGELDLTPPQHLMNGVQVKVSQWDSHLHVK
jgi:hypothetical protein